MTHLIAQWYRAVACDVTSAAFNQNVWQNVWYLYRERRVFNFSVVVERVTAKPLWYDNRLSVHYQKSADMGTYIKC